jgi:hypothetical protein
MYACGGGGQSFESPLELAMHLTLLELHCGLLAVRPREFTSLLWTQSALKHKHPDMGGGYHLHRYIQHTNQRIVWIAREVLIYGMEIDSLKRAICFFIHVAECAYKLNSFNTVFQVVEALKLPAIKRLSAWDSFSTTKLETFEALSIFCDASHNYANYRQHLRSLGSQARIPCLPVLLKDISLLEMSNPWKVVRSSPDSADHELIDLHKMEALFRLLCREVFSLRSPFITSFYTSKLFCRVHLQPPKVVCGDRDGETRERRGRACRIDSRNDQSDLYTESFFMNDSHPGAHGHDVAATTTSSTRQLQQLSLNTLSEEFTGAASTDGGDSDDECEDELGSNRSYVVIYMSLNNGTMEEDFFDNCSDSPAAISDHMETSIPMPTSRFLTLTSYLPVPLFSLKMKKQIQGQEKHLDLKIQQQMSRDITTRLSCSHSNGRWRASVGEDEKGGGVKLSPLKKRQLNTVAYPEPLATIPHTMSIMCQDAVQSYAQCIIDEQLFVTTTHLDIPVASSRREDGGVVDGGRTKDLSKKHSAVFSLFGRGDCGSDIPQIQGNMATNIALTAYDDKVLALYRDTLG